MPRPLIPRRELEEAVEKKRQEEQAAAIERARTLEATRREEEAIRLAREKTEREAAEQKAREEADRERIARAEAAARAEFITAQANAKIEARKTLASNIAKLSSVVGTNNSDAEEQFIELLAGQSGTPKIIIFDKPQPNSITTAYEAMQIFAHSVDGQVIDGNYIRAFILGNDIYKFDEPSVHTTLQLHAGVYYQRYFCGNTLAKIIQDLLQAETKHLHDLKGSRLLLCMGKNSTLNAEFIKRLSTLDNIIVCVATDTGQP